MLAASREATGVPTNTPDRENPPHSGFPATGAATLHPSSMSAFLRKEKTGAARIPFNHASFAAAMRGITPHRMACA